MCHFYILHSPSKDKYYIGATCDTLESRLAKHNMKHLGYTGDHIQILGLGINFTQSEEEKLHICNPSKLSSEFFDFGIE